MKGAPRFNPAFLLITLLPFLALGQSSFEKDSIAIIRKDSIAFKLYLSKPDSTIHIANNTLNNALQINSKYLEGVSYYVLSKAYWAKANYRLSTEYGFKALRIFENSKHTDRWAESLLSLARTFIDLQNYVQAANFIGRATALCQYHSNEAIMASAFREHSMLLSELKQYDSALYYADAGLSIYEKLKDSLNTSILYGRKAKIYFHQKNFSNSHLYNQKSLLYDSLVGNRRALGVSYYQAALDAVHLNDYKKAITLLNKSIPVSQEIGNIKTLIKVHNLLADIYQEQGKPQLVTANLRKVSQYKDSLYSAEKNGQIQEMQLLYELSSKEKTIQALEQENSLKQQQVKNQRLFLAFLLVFILFLVLLTFFLIRLRRVQSKANLELTNKNTAIEQQKEEIEVQAESLHQLNQLKSKLFSVISHDLRGPIATLSALLELLTNRRMTPDEFLKITDKLKGNLNLTQRTLENLLNWSLSQMEGIRTEPQKINLKNTINEACHLLQEIAARKNISVEIKLEDPIDVFADPNQVQLILRNLIHNAVKFSEPSSNVLVSAYRDRNLCRITVKDFGIGMTQEEIETILGSKNYFSKIGTQQEKGTGLGLLLCKEFIKRNGGDMQISSTVNEGTEVTFSLNLFVSKFVLEGTSKRIYS